MKKTLNKKISEMYNNYSKILINWKLEPIALIIAVMSYKDPYSALKVYSLVTVFIHMPIVIFRAYTKIKKLNALTLFNNKAVKLALAKAVAKTKTIIYTKKNIYYKKIHVVYSCTGKCCWEKWNIIDKITGVNYY